MRPYCPNCGCSWTVALCRSRSRPLRRGSSLWWHLWRQCRAVLRGLPFRYSICAPGSVRAAWPLGLASSFSAVIDGACLSIFHFSCKPLSSLQEFMGFFPLRSNLLTRHLRIMFPFVPHFHCLIFLSEKCRSDSLYVCLSTLLLLFYLFFSLVSVFWKNLFFCSFHANRAYLWILSSLLSIPLLLPPPPHLFPL